MSNIFLRLQIQDMQEKTSYFLVLRCSQLEYSFNSYVYFPLIQHLRYVKLHKSSRFYWMETNGICGIPLFSNLLDKNLINFIALTIMDRQLVYPNTSKHTLSNYAQFETKATGTFVSLVVELEINLIEEHSFYIPLLIDEGNPNEEINISSFQFVCESYC